MDSILSKAGSFLLARRAKQEASSMGDEINAMSSSVEAGARTFFNRLRGKMQTPLPELLQKFNLPAGLFPKNATHYEFDEATNKLTVLMPWICEACFRDTSVVRYAASVTAILEDGKLSNIEGMKTKVFVWVKVTSISVSNDKVHFNVGMKKSRPKEAYDILKDAFEVEVF